MRDLGFARPKLDPSMRKLLARVGSIGVPMLEEAGGRSLADGVTAQLLVLETALGMDLAVPKRDFFPRKVRDEKGRLIVQYLGKLGKHSNAAGQKVSAPHPEEYLCSEPPRGQLISLAALWKALVRYMDTHSLNGPRWGHVLSLTLIVLSTCAWLISEFLLRDVSFRMANANFLCGHRFRLFWAFTLPIYALSFAAVLYWSKARHKPMLPALSLLVLTIVFFEVGAGVLLDLRDFQGTFTGNSIRDDMYLYVQCGVVDARTRETM